MIAISSCLTGEKCRYNGECTYNQLLMENTGKEYIALCPEILSGFGIPRTPCEILGGSGEDVLTGAAKIIDKNGNDITERMVIGAEKALQICLKEGVTKVYLQPRSPTCGCGTIYDGSFNGTLKSGNGIFTALLIGHGIEVEEVNIP